MTAPAHPFRRVLRVATLVAAVVFLYLLGTTAWKMWTIEETVRGDLEAVTAKGAADVALEMRAVEEATTSLAEAVASGRLSEAEMLERFRMIVDSDSYVLEAGVAFVPGKGPRPGPCAPHWGLREGRRQAFRVEESYDYTKADWFVAGMESGPLWGDPYFGQATRAWTAGYLVPIRRPGADSSEPPIGVVRINHSMTGFRRLIEALPLGNEGYACLNSMRTGLFVYHPIEDLVKNRMTLRSLAAANRDSDIWTLGERAMRGEVGWMERKAFMTGEASWTFFHPVPGTDWTLIVMFMKQEMIGDAREAVREEMRLALVLALLLSLLVLLSLRIEAGDSWRLWTAAAAVTLLLVAAIGFIWRLSFDIRLHNAALADAVHDRSDLQEFQTDRNFVSRDRGEPDPLFVPTGVFIRSIEFKNATDVVVSGYVWQKYQDGLHDPLTRGVVFPEAVEEKVTEAYRYRNGAAGLETIGWSFRATLRQRFDFSRYPLDVQNVRLVVGRRDFDKNVILVPDLDAYRSMIPQTLPGLDRAFVMAGWTPLKSFFRFLGGDFNTNFGISRFVGGQGYPDLSFHVLVRRAFLAPFISNIVPLFLIAGIAFILLCLISGDPAWVAAYDARAGRVTGTTAALFFAVLLAHIRLRGDLQGLNETIYIEYFYFAMYAACLAIVADVYAVGSKMPWRLVAYRDNIVPRLLFWPVLSLAFLATTVLFFY